MLTKLRDKYSQGKNVMLELKKHDPRIEATDEMVEISYDLQSGSYIKAAERDPARKKKYTRALAKVINGLGVKSDSIVEAGVGEATTLANLVPKLSQTPRDIYGFDISWSRCRYALEYVRSKQIEGVQIFLANLFNIPLPDSCVDIVYTSHSIEPNRGREKEALIELYRVARKFLILLEPSYELADKDARKRMDRHGYIKALHKEATLLNMEIIDHRLFDVILNPLNPTGLMVIKKRVRGVKKFNQIPFVCPVTRRRLELMRGSYFSKKGLLAYPIMDGIPCLMAEHAIVASHYGTKFDRLFTRNKS